MNPAELNELTATFSAEPVSCVDCGSDIAVESNFCLRCLLSTGLDVPDSDSDAGDFAQALDEVAVPDTGWSLGAYDILEEIGRGGMGIIYRARQRLSNRIVAVKRILTYHADSLETVARFRREAEAAASLDHPNILPIHEVAETEDGLPYFSMKFATGGSLLEARARFAGHPRASVALMAKVARAMQKAHAHGILHRDLKPGNILLDDHGEPLVSDFGLAKWLDRQTDLTRTLTVFGTPGYIAPEQASGPAERLTSAADIYSIGAILFELLAGRPPFLGEHAWAVLNQAREKTAPRLRALRPNLDRDLDTICARCLEREPNQRYRSAAEVAEDLESWLVGRPIKARPLTPLARIWRWSQRNPVLAGSIAAAFASIALALIYLAHNHALEGELRQTAMEKHSVAILPFLDLDHATPDFTSAQIAGDALRESLGHLGPAKVTVLPDKLASWSGTGNIQEVRHSADQTRSRSVLSGTRRQTPTGVRYSMHLNNGETGEIIHDWTFEVNQSETFAEKFVGSDAAPLTYRWLDAPALQRPAAQFDPATNNERARLLIARGRELMNRRNIPDMDRAIACLEGAMQEEPKSIDARAYLVFALIGRDYLSASPELAARAKQIADESVKLAPNNPTANRAICYVEDSRGNYEVSLDYAFRAFEDGDRSERAFSHFIYIWTMCGRPDIALRWLQLTRHTSEAAQNDAMVGDCWTILTADEKARAAYQSAATLQPDQPDGWIGLCRLRLLADDPNGAREICRRELPKFAQSPFARRMEAMIEFFSRNFGQAEKLYRALETDDPMGGIKTGFYAALDHRSPLACALLANGHAAEAEPVLASCLAAEEKHLADVPHDPYSLYRKSSVECMLGQKKEALADLRAAIDAGWIDYRATLRDPRFDHLSHDPEFDQILADCASKVAAMAHAESPPDSSPR